MIINDLKLKKVYFPFVKSEIQKFLVYKTSFIIWLLCQILYVTVNCYLWIAIYKSANTDYLNGFTLREMIMYIILSFALTSMTSVGIFTLIGKEITDGSIAINLIRPIKYRRMIFFKTLGNKFPRLILVFLPCLIWLTNFKSNITIENSLMFFLSIILSFLINFLFEFCVAMIIFYTTYSIGLNILKATLVRMFSGSLIPLTFFSTSTQKILEYLPFKYTIYIPVMLYLDTNIKIRYFKILMIQVIWILFFYVISNFLWARAIKRLSILGG